MSNGWDWVEQVPRIKKAIRSMEAGMVSEFHKGGVVRHPGAPNNDAIPNTLGDSTYALFNHQFETKDSGVREERPSGYVRDTQQGKPRFDLLLADGVPYQQQFLTRFAELLARGSEKYGDRNWELADDEESLDRFQSSAFRHLMQWMNGETDEDHAAAVAYNLFAYESTIYKMERQVSEPWHS